MNLYCQFLFPDSSHPSNRLILPVQFELIDLDPYSINVLSLIIHLKNKGKNNFFKEKYEVTFNKHLFFILPSYITCK